MSQAVWIHDGKQFCGMSHTLERGQGEEDGPNGIAACEPWTLGLQPNPHQRTLLLIATEGFIVFGIVQHTSKLKDRYKDAARNSNRASRGLGATGALTLLPSEALAFSYRADAAGEVEPRRFRIPCNDIGLEEKSVYFSTAKLTQSFCIS